MNAFQSQCRQIVDATDLRWEWDARFCMVVAAFDAAAVPPVEALLDRVLDRPWTPTNLAGAPERIRDAAQRLGGMRAGQRLWTGRADAPVMAVCPWWPWGGGDRFSLRIGYDGCAADQDATHQGVAFKRWFGL